MQLEKVDYAILDYLAKVKDANPKEISQNIKSTIDITNYRIKELSTPTQYQHIFKMKLPVTDSGYISTKDDVKTPETKYYITILGKKALEDYRVIQNEHLAKTREERFWRIVPIIISIIALIVSIFALFKD